MKKFLERIGLALWLLVGVSAFFWSVKNISEIWYNTTHLELCPEAQYEGSFVMGDYRARVFSLDPKQSPVDRRQIVIDCSNSLLKFEENGYIFLYDHRAQGFDAMLANDTATLYGVRLEKVAYAHGSMDRSLEGYLDDGSIPSSKNVHASLIMATCDGIGGIHYTYWKIAE